MHAGDAAIHAIQQAAQVGLCKDFSRANRVWHLKRVKTHGQNAALFQPSGNSSMRAALNSQQLPRPAFRYSQLVKVGPHYYFSGLLGQDRQTGALVSDGVGPQAVQILANLQVLMQEFGLGFEHLAMVRLFTTDMSRFGEINAAWEQVFDATPHAPPARTSVGVAALPLQSKVEMEFTFYKE